MKKKPDKNSLNKDIITEIGVDLNNKLLIDQDTQEPLIFNGKKLVLVDEESKLEKGETPFDPINNRKLMTSLLSYNNAKLVEEGSAAPISIFYQLDPDKDGKSAIEVRDEENNKFTSRLYYNDSLKVADILFKMNNDDRDLTSYDEKIKPITTKKKPRRKTS